MFDSLDDTFIGPERGKIPLFGKGAVGLYPLLDRIGLHQAEDELPYQKYQGLIFHLTIQASGPVDSDVSDLVRGMRFRVKMPGSAVPYEAEMQGWIYDTDNGFGTTWFKPSTLTLSGEQGDDICFAILDNYSLDPGFPFYQFGFLKEKGIPGTVPQRATIYSVGVNHPVSKLHVPGWATDIPSEEELLELQKPGWWKGIWEIEFDLSSSVVDPDFADYNLYSLRVQRGEALFDDGELSHVSFKYVGDNTKSWPENMFGGSTLTMLSGAAEGKQYTVVGNMVTGNNPPPGVPPNECVLEIFTGLNTPFSDGALPGDLYRVKTYFASNVETLLHDKVYISVGANPAKTLIYSVETT